MVKSVGLCFPKPQKWRPQMSFFCFLSIAQIYSVHFPRGVKRKSENFDFFHKKICSNQLMSCVVLHWEEFLLFCPHVCAVLFPTTSLCVGAIWIFELNTALIRIWQWGWYQWGDIIIKWMLLQSWVIWISLGIADPAANNENCHRGNYRI